MTSYFYAQKGFVFRVMGACAIQDGVAPMQLVFNRGGLDSPRPTLQRECEAAWRDAQIYGHGAVKVWP